MQSLVFILVLFGLSQLVEGQERSDFYYFDSLTYKQYTDGDWKELSKSGKKAISLGYEYYYMSMRVGISYYERKNYLIAQSYFRKALEFNNNDQVALEYLYYCYLLSGKYPLANSFTQQFGESVKKKTGVDIEKSNRISVDYLYNNSISNDIVTEYLSMNGLIDEGTLFIPLSYFNFGISMYHEVSPAVGIKHSLSYLKRKNSYWINDGSDAYPDYEQHVNQLQYFFSTIVTNSSGLSVMPSIYYLHTRYPLIDFSTNGMQNFALTYQVAENNLGAGLHLSQTSGLLDIGGSINLSRLGFRNHFQAGADLELYPLGNNYFHFGASYYAKLSGVNDGYEKSYVIETRLGFSAGGKVFLNMSMLMGDLENFVDNKGQIVYNGINEIDRIIKADISVPAGRSGVVFYLGSRYSMEYTAYIPLDYVYSVKSENSFKSISIIGGLSWTF